MKQEKWEVEFNTNQMDWFDSWPDEGEGTVNWDAIHDFIAKLIQQNRKATLKEIQDIINSLEVKNDLIK